MVLVKSKSDKYRAAVTLLDILFFYSDRFVHYRLNRLSSRWGEPLKIFSKMVEFTICIENETMIRY